MKYYAIALFAVLMSSGCSTTEGGRVFTLTDNVHSEESHNIPNTKTKEFSFKIGGISQQVVKEKIIADLKERVAVKFTNQPIQARKKADAFSDVITALNQHGNNTKIKLYADIKWRITADGSPEII
jgi:NADPH-dependent glutamate synthase beta subunit-like oxidoreductase